MPVEFDSSSQRDRPFGLIQDGTKLKKMEHQNQNPQAYLSKTIMYVHIM